MHALKSVVTLCLALSLSALFWAMPCTANDFTASIDYNYQSWRSDEDETGTQLYVPIHLNATTEKYEFGITAGYASTTADLAGEEKGGMHSWLDTQINFSYEIGALAGIQWLFALDLNLPTGRTGQKEKDLFAMSDPDLFTINKPGRGTNINPTLSVAKELGDFLIGLGIGFNSQGKYDYSENVENYDPGDSYTMVAMLEYDFTNGWILGLDGQYASYGIDRQDGDDFQEKGDAWQIGGRLTYSASKWSLGASVKSIFREKGKFQTYLNTLETEDENGYGDEWQADLSWQYQLFNRTSVTARAEYVFVDENKYDETSYLYSGKRTKYGFGLGADHKVTDNLFLDGMVTYFKMKDDPNWRHPDEDREYKGWTCVIGLTYKR